MTGPPVIIPTHSRRDLLEHAVASCTGCVVVVDDSPNGMAPIPGVTWLRTRGAEGFARAVNRGLAHTSTEGNRCAVILNDDARLDPGCGEHLEACWETRGGIGGPVLRDATGAVQSAGFRLRWWGRLRAETRVPERLAEVDAVSGACMVLGTTWRFDPAYTHGMEDIALCRRVWLAGGSVWVTPDATCHHVGGATVSTRSASAQRNAVAGHLRLVGGGWRSGVVVGLALGQVVREGGGMDRARAVFDGIRDARRSRDRSGDRP